MEKGGCAQGRACVCTRGRGLGTPHWRTSTRGAARATWMTSMASSLWQRPSSLWGATSWLQRCDSSSRARAISSFTLSLGEEGLVRGARSEAHVDVPVRLPATSCLPRPPLRFLPAPPLPRLWRWRWTHHLIGEERGLQQPDLLGGQEAPKPDSLQLAGQLGAVDDVTVGRGGWHEENSRHPSGKSPPPQPQPLAGPELSCLPSTESHPCFPISCDGSSICSVSFRPQTMESSCLLLLSHPHLLLLQNTAPKLVSLKLPR